MELHLEPFQVGFLIVGAQNGRRTVLAVSPDARHDGISSAVATVDGRGHDSTVKQEGETNKVTNEKRTHIPGQKGKNTKTDIPSYWSECFGPQTTARGRGNIHATFATSARVIEINRLQECDDLQAQIDFINLGNCPC